MLAASAARLPGHPASPLRLPPVATIGRDELGAAGQCGIVGIGADLLWCPLPSGRRSLAATLWCITHATMRRQNLPRLGQQPGIEVIIGKLRALLEPGRARLSRPARNGHCPGSGRSYAGRQGADSHQGRPG